MIMAIDIIILTCLYFLFSFYLLIKILKRIKSKKVIDLKSFFDIYYLIFYGVVPIFTLCNLNNSDMIIDYFFSYNAKYYYALFFLTLIMYIIIQIIFKFKIQIQKKNTKHFIIDINSNRFLLLNIFFSIIGLFSLIMWTKAFGKPWDIIKYASRIRSGYSPIYNPYTFLKPLCYFSTISLFGSIMLIKAKHKFINSLVLAISLFSTVVFALACDSRSYILIVILTILLYKMNKNIKINTSRLIKYLAVFCVLFVFFSELNNITSYIRDKKWEHKATTVTTSVINNFSYTYRNGINILFLLDSGIYDDYSELEDIKAILMSWVPDRYKNNIVTNLFQRHTKYYEGIGGAQPTDLITASLYKFHLLGIIIMPLIIVFFIKKLELLFSHYNSKYTFMIYNYIGCDICKSFISSYDLSYILFCNLFIIVSFIAVTLFCREEKKVEIENAILNN